jgi:metallo-beta-lactamase class B
MPSIVTDKPFASITDYPEVANDYAYTFKAMKALTFDIWLASHASQFALHIKHKPDDVYNPSAFIDRAGYDAQLNDLQKKFEEKLKQ